MRFSSNEGQNMAPDVILILIKLGRVVVIWEREGGRGGLESILLNTINPFFIFAGNKGYRLRPSPRPPAPCLGDMEVGGR